MTRTKKYLLGGGLAALGFALLVSFGSLQSDDLQGSFISPTITDPITEAEAIKMIVADTGVTLVSTPTTCTITFADPTAWYYTYALTACENGWITAFDPSSLYTRAEVSKIAYLAYAVPYYMPSSPSFTDISGYWFEPYVESLNAAGAYRYSFGAFRPNMNVTKDWLRYLVNHL